MARLRETDDPPDEKTVADSETAVAQPQDNWVRKQSPPLDFSPASTAVDPSDAKQDLGAGYAVGRFDYTPNATYTDGDLPAQSDAATTLNQFNREQDSHSDEDVESARRETDIRRDTEGWGNQIGLTDTEIDAAIRIVETVSTGVRRNFGLDTVCLGTLTLVANQNTHGTHTTKSIRLNGPNTDNHDLVTKYEQLRADLGVTRARVSDFRRWYNRNHS